MSQSAHSDRFLLKGALLFTIWYDMPHRATRDADMLGFGPSDLESIAQTFRDIANVEVDDGISFDPASVCVEAIRKDAGYDGARVTIAAEIAKARCKTQIDVGFGDAVTPGPIDAVYPVLLDDFPAPLLRIYPVYTVIAEKLHAIDLLGMTNSQMKDYFDLSVLLEQETLDAGILAAAIAATFARRGTAVPTSPPIGLTGEFASDSSRIALWHAFIKQNGLAQQSLSDNVTKLNRELVPALAGAALLADRHL